MATSLPDLLYAFLKKITSTTSGATEDLAISALLTALDPEFALSTQLPEGGTTGQSLVKTSAANYDTEWADPTGGGGGTLVLDVSPTSGNSYTTSALTALAADEKFYVEAIAKSGTNTILEIQINGRSGASDYSVGLKSLTSSVSINDITGGENWGGTTAVNTSCGCLEEIDGVPYGFFFCQQMASSTAAFGSRRDTGGKLLFAEAISTITFKLYGAATFAAGSRLRVWRVRK